MTVPNSGRPIDHVVVLMLENRSFDHMFGLLDPDPGKYDGVAVNDQRFSNPSDPTKTPADPVYVSADATFGLTVDPPHSHASVVEQMGLGGLGAPQMNGFVAAYKRTLAGDKKGRPVYHWFRIVGVGLILLALIAALLANPWPWRLLAAGFLVLTALGGLAHYLRSKAPSLPISAWRQWLIYSVVAVPILMIVSVLFGSVVGYLGRLAGLLIMLAAAGGVAVWIARKKVRSPPPAQPEQEREIMRCMRPMEQLPALAALAQSFAICTRWHCSVPGATWPNRLFAHAGTSDDTVDIEVGLYDNDTIFDRLNEASQRWHIYQHPEGLAQVSVFSKLTDDDNLKNWYPISELSEHVEGGQLPAYSFIEPCHEGPTSNSQHPGNNDFDAPADSLHFSDFERGERLIVSVYETLRKKREVFDRTVLIITYDEHGGFYDHASPPTNAVAPVPINVPKRTSTWPQILGWFVEQPSSRFKFNVLGPRVPAVVISPLIQHQVDSTLYDHSAIPATVRKLFAPNTAKLSEREDRSNKLEHLWSAGVVRDDVPDLSTIYPPRAALLERAVEKAPVRRRDDEFAQQMREVERKLRPKLVRKSPLLLERSGVPGANGGSPESVSQALMERAKEARAGR